MSGGVVRTRAEMVDELLGVIGELPPAQACRVQDLYDRVQEVGADTLTAQDMAHVRDIWDAAFGEPCTTT